MAQAVVRVRTPENVDLEYQLAGIGSRAVAQIIDLLILALAYILLGIAVAYWGSSHGFAGSASYVVGIAILLSFFLFWGYFILFEYYMSGQTLGKRIVKVRVLRRDGRNTTFVPVLLRNLFRIVDILPNGYLVGVIVMLIDGNERRLGDLVAGTMVVKSRPQQQFVWLEAAEDEDNTLSQASVLPAPETPEERPLVSVKGVPLSFALNQELPPSWQEFLLGLDKRLKNMSRRSRELVVSDLWRRLLEEELVFLMSEQGQELTRDALVTNSDKLKLVAALSKYVRQQKRGKHA